MALKQMIAAGNAESWVSQELPSLRVKYQKLPYVARVARFPDPIVEFGDSVRWIVDFISQKGAKVILLGQPVLWKSSMATEERQRLWFRIATPDGSVRPSGGWLLQEMTRYNAIQKNVAMEKGGVFVDLDSKMPKTVEYYFDDCHFTDKGSKLVAESALPVLEGVLDQVVDARADIK